MVDQVMEVAGEVAVHPTAAVEEVAVVGEEKIITPVVIILDKMRWEKVLYEKKGGEISSKI